MKRPFAYVGVRDLKVTYVDEAINGQSYSHGHGVAGDVMDPLHTQIVCQQKLPTLSSHTSPMTNTKSAKSSAVSGCMFRLTSTSLPTPK